MTKNASVNPVSNPVSIRGSKKEPVDAADAIVTATDLRAYYITKAYGVERTVKAVDDISLAIKAGEVYGLAGESGCGKSTLLKVLLGDVQPPLMVVGGSVSYRFGG